MHFCSYQVLAVASDVKVDENNAVIGGKKIEVRILCIVCYRIFFIFSFVASGNCCFSNCGSQALT